MSSQNPFAILGFAPNFVENLSEAELAELLKSQARKLMAMYHSDGRFPDVERFREIQNAYASLDPDDRDEKIYGAIKRAFLKPGPFRKQLRDLEIGLRAAKTLEGERHLHWMSYLASASGLNGDELTIFNCGPCRLKMYDHSLTIHQPAIGDRPSGRAKVFYEMKVATNGSVGIKRGKQRKFASYPDKGLIGTIDHSTASRYKGIKSILLNLTSGVLTPEEDILMIGGPFYPRLDEEQVIAQTDRIRPQLFQNISLLLTPRITEDSHLFSINRDGDQTYFSYDGTITKIIKGKG
jgi:hypothetical protein